MAPTLDQEGPEPAPPPKPVHNGRQCLSHFLGSDERPHVGVPGFAKQFGQQTIPLARLAAPQRFAQLRDRNVLVPEEVWPPGGVCEIDGQGPHRSYGTTGRGTTRRFPAARCGQPANRVQPPLRHGFRRRGHRRRRLERQRCAVPCMGRSSIWFWSGTPDRLYEVAADRTPAASAPRRGCARPGRRVCHRGTAWLPSREPFHRGLGRERQDRSHAAQRRSP